MAALEESAASRLHSSGGGGVGDTERYTVALMRRDAARRNTGGGTGDRLSDRPPTSPVDEITMGETCEEPDVDCLQNEVGDRRDTCPTVSCSIG